MWQKFSTLLDKKMKKKGIANSLLASRVCYQALIASDGLFNPISFKDGTLLVGVSSSASAAALQLSKSQVIQKINHKLDQEIVKNIKIKVEN
ncbi:MAG: DciA family protein [Candidatus Berkelbacteria bacterium]|nr:DciA family protein [Candidatus Berkelbacteria bacterium]